MNTVDVKYAEALGYTEIEATDYGQTVGRRPDGTIQYIPSPTNNIDHFYSLMNYMITKEGTLIFTKNKEGSFILNIREKQYKANDLRTVTLKAFLGGTDG